MMMTTKTTRRRRGHCSHTKPDKGNPNHHARVPGQAAPAASVHDQLDKYKPFDMAQSSTSQPRDCVCVCTYSLT